MEALKDKIRRSAVIAAHHRIHSRWQSILERTGVQPSSSELIRELRSGEGRYVYDVQS
jgi:hypothetical protein